MLQVVRLLGVVSVYAIFDCHHDVAYSSSSCELFYRSLTLLDLHLKELHSVWISYRLA